MKIRVSLALLLTALLTACQAVEQSPPIQTDEGFLFGPPRARVDQVMTIASRSLADGDVVTDDGNGVQAINRMKVERVRHIERVVRSKSGARETRLELRILIDQIRTQLAGRNSLAEGTAPGPLANQVLKGRRDGEDWELQLQGGAGGEEEEAELLALQAYENRAWYVPQRVRVGDEWPLTTLYLKHILRRELPRATLVGKARLEEVRAGFARISVRIHGEGERQVDPRISTYATLQLEGELIVDLETLLDRKLTLTGVLNTGTTVGRAGSDSHLPMEIVVEKSWAKDR